MMARWTTAVVALLALAVGCAQRPSEKSPENTRTALVEPENALSEELMICLGQARNFHHKADVLLDDDNIEAAAIAIARILEIPFPEDAPESEDALLDTRARLAKLHIELGHLDDAMSIVDSGIAAATRRSFFLANLHTVRGEVFEAIGKSAEPGSSEQNRAKMQAIEALDRSIAINNELLETLKQMSPATPKTAPKP